MSGGSNDDSTLCIAHRDGDGRAVVDLVVNQGPPPPFDPDRAVAKFCPILDEYRVRTVHGDAYAGETFRAKFAAHGGTAFQKIDATASDLYELLEVPLNTRNVILPDVPVVEQQLLGLVWRGGKIDHPPGEHDDYANAVAGAVYLLTKARESFAPIVTSFTRTHVPFTEPRDRHLDEPTTHPHERIERTGPPEMSERKRRAWAGTA